jgi:exodeoxyribonuclease VII small subunit
MAKNVPVQSFEESLKELEGLVKQFESGEFTLDQAIAAYERGFFLKEQCLTKLQQAKAKIESVMAEKPILKAD